MNSNREQTLFAQALDITTPEERAAFLDRVCGSDEFLRSRLNALLAAHEVTAAFLPEVSHSLAAKPEALPGEALGDLLGRYKLLERVGEGGCGVVYVAEQTEPMRRRVALKVIKLGMDTKSVVARFEAERQALAMMDHPNIARVLDAGATDRGRPYFVMELVRGIPITHYCDQNNLNTHSRLELFIKVCQAIQHAHQKGIIHRDIKPSNILVTVNDGVPVPKVIDFGIAKATEGRLTDNTVYTQLHQFIGTPAYMSPEQAEMTSLDIDTRSDIYSLGVLLYELLSGRTPFEAKELMAAGLDSMRKVIREQEPARPSTKLGTLQGDELSTTAKRRSTEVLKLLRQLEGDLDWITMKCLEKDRTRRYETASGLAADILRHLGNEPVLARPPSTTYRFQKAYQRNKTSFAVTALLAFVLLAATAFSARQARIARAAVVVAQHAQAETAARERTERAAREDAESVVKFLGGVFRSADPKEDSRNVTVEAALKRAAARLENELGEQPARKAALQSAIAETYLGLGLFSDARPLLEQVVASQRSRLGQEHTNTLNAMARLAAAAGYLGRTEEALQLRDEVTQIRKRVLGPEHPETLTIMLELASSQFEATQRAAEANQLARHVFEVRQRVLGPDHAETMEALWLLVHQGDGEAIPAVGNLIPTARARLDRSRRENGPQHVKTIYALAHLADLIPSEGNNAVQEKIQLCREAVELSQRVYGPEHLQTVHMKGRLGHLLMLDGDFADASKALAEVVELSVKAHGPNHHCTLESKLGLAEAFLKAGRLEDAVRLAKDAVNRFRESLPAAHRVRHMLTAASILGRSPDMAHTQDAIQVLEEGIKIIHQHKTYSSLTKNFLVELAVARARVGRHGEAHETLQELEAHLLRIHGKESMETAIQLRGAGAAYLLLNRPDDAVRVLESALSFWRAHPEARVPGDKHPEGRVRNVNEAETLLAMAQQWIGGWNKQIKLQEETLADRRKLLEPGHPDLIQAISDLEVTYHFALRWDESVRLSQELVDLAVKHGTNSRASLDAHSRLAMRLDSAGRIDDAIKTWREIIRMNPGESPNSHYQVGKALMDRRQYADALPVLRATQRFYPVGDRGQETRDLIDLAEAGFGDEQPGAGRRESAPERAFFEKWLRKLQAQLLSNPADMDKMKHVANVHLWLGETHEHQALCRKLLELAANSKDPTVHDRAAKAYLVLAHPDPALLKQAVWSGRQTLKLANATHEYWPWFLITAAMAEVRDNRPAEAERLLNQVFALPDTSKQRRGLALAYRTLARARLNRFAEARTDLTRLESLQPPFPAPPTASTILFSPEEMAAFLAREEARALLNSPPTAKQ